MITLKNKKIKLMNEDSKMESDVIKLNNNNMQYSHSNSNKSQNEEDDQIKSVNNIIPLFQLSSLSRNMCYSEDSISKQKNHFSSSTTAILNNNPKKNSDSIKGSNQSHILFINTLSPSKKKKFSSFKMVEKSKYKKFSDEYNYIKKTEQETISERERRDAFGNIIKKKNKKKIKVSFVDEINKEQPLVTFVDIECFKKYNINIGIPKEEHIKKNNMSTNCQCCFIF